MRFNLLKLLGSVQRTERDRRALTEDRPLGAQGLLFAALAAALLAGVLPVLTSRELGWNELRPEVPLAHDSTWKAYYGDTPRSACQTLEDARPGCPAHAASPLLWKSPLSRFDGPDTSADHRKRAEPRKGKDYWVGFVIPADTAVSALATGAQHLQIGHFWATYDIWINGRYMSGGGGVDDAAPVTLTLTPELLDGRAPLQVAVRVIFDSDYPVPDHFCPDLPTGLMTRKTAQGYLVMMSFWERVRPFALMLAYALMGALFFFFWLPTPARQEYFYMSLFALAAAAYQARWTDMLSWSYARNANLGVDLFLNTYLAGFAMFLGFSFARLRRAVFRWGFPALLAAPALMSLVFTDPSSRFQIRQWLYYWWEPLAFLAGGVACAAQALYLKLSVRDASPVPHRIRRLTLFALGMMGAAVLYFVLKRHLFSGGHRHFWHGFEQLAFMVYFAAIALREYREQQALVGRAPVSDYHRRPVLPERVTGALLSLDLKGSEPLYRQRAEAATDDLVGLWRSDMSRVLARRGGTLVLRKGDEIAVLFEAQSGPDALARALAAYDEAAALTEVLAAEWSQQGLLPAGVSYLRFRAALSEGSLKPAWEQVGTSREAVWEEAGNSSPFVENSRLLDLEKTLGGEEDVRLTRLVVRQELSARMDRGTAEDRVLRDKHGREYRVSVILARPPVARASKAA